MSNIQPPAWLNQDFIQQAMRKSLNNDSWTIQSCNITAPLGPNENHASYIFRANLVVETENGMTEKKSLILKSLPDSEKLQKSIHMMEFFRKEGRILCELIPQMEHILPKSNRKFSPKCYFFQDEPLDLLIMEDLCEDGYKLCNRLTGLDLDHTLLVVKNLAAYHAGTRVLVKKNPELRKGFADTFWNPAYNEKTASMVETAFTGFAKEAEKWDVFPKSTVEKLYNLITTAHKRKNKLWTVDENFKLNTILHGDCWVNNIMFKYDSNGKVKVQTFLDFQIASYHSIMLDLMYFIYTSLTDQVSIEHTETIKKVYYDELTSILKQTEPELEFTYDEFEQEYRDKLFEGLWSTVVVYPIICEPHEKEGDTEEPVTQDSKNEKNLFDNPRYKEVMVRIIPYFDSQGII